MGDGARIRVPAPPHLELEVIADSRQHDQRDRNAGGPRVWPERQDAQVVTEQQGCRGAHQRDVQLEYGTHNDRPVQGRRSVPAAGAGSGDDARG